MKTILMTAYAINPYKGSEDGTGWNFVLAAARQNRVIAITRKNNQPHIDRYCEEHAIDRSNLQFAYYDTPYWMRWWKKGPLLSVIYFYMWQLGVALWVKSKKFQFDIAHSLNFHSDWTPSFLWLLGKPFVWGPVGHHPAMPKKYLLDNYGYKAYLKDRMLWVFKNIFWTFDPFLKITKYKADHIFCINSVVPLMLGLKKNYSIVPAVAIDKIEKPITTKENFKVITIGRMVALKGFRTALEVFIRFYNNLSDEKKQSVKLEMIGNGPDIEWLKKQVSTHQLEGAVEIIPWLERKEVLQKYKEASVFLFPSHEGAGMVVPEAMANGLPVLCYDNEGPGELSAPSSQLKVLYNEHKDNIATYSKLLNRLFNEKQLLEVESKWSLRHTQKHLWSMREVQLNNVYDKILTTYETRTSYTFAK